MKIFYRISPSKAGYKKDKPDYINNKNCLHNFLQVFIKNNIECIKTTLISDVKDFVINEYSYEEQNDYLTSLVRKKWIYDLVIDEVSYGNGAESFNYALDLALKIEDDEEIVYFVENDYLHRPNSYKWILDGLNNMNFDIVSLYNHPDKFLPPSKGGNPNVDTNGGYMTKIYQGELGHWMLTDSTTMTFACKVKTLKQYENVFRKHTTGTYPRDYDMFKELTINNQLTLATPIEPVATHGESKWLTKFYDWSNVEY